MWINVRIPRSIFLVVGDSEAERFEGLILEHEDGPTVVKARWQPVSRMSELFTQGCISEYLTRVLMEMRLVMRTEEGESWPFPLLPRPDSPAETAAYKPRDPEKLVLLFTFGETDLWDVAHALPYTDFDLNSEREAGTVRSRVAERCQPLFDTIRALRTAGYTNLFIHALSPPTSREEPHWPSYAVRFKLAVVFNQSLEEFACSEQVGYVTIWDMVFADPGRKREYSRDSQHLNKLAGVRSVARLYEQLKAGDRTRSSDRIC